MEQHKLIKGLVLTTEIPAYQRFHDLLIINFKVCYFIAFCGILMIFQVFK